MHVNKRKNSEACDPKFCLVQEFFMLKVETTNPNTSSWGQGLFVKRQGLFLIEPILSL